MSEAGFDISTLERLIERLDTLRTDLLKAIRALEQTPFSTRAQHAIIQYKMEVSRLCDKIVKTFQCQLENSQSDTLKTGQLEALSRQFTVQICDQ